MSEYKIIKPKFPPLRLAKGDRIRLVTMSDPRTPEQWDKTLECQKWLEGLGLEVLLGNSMRLTTPEENHPRERAKDLHEAFEDQKTKMIFDVSGGDRAGEVLEYVDFAAIRQHTKPYLGFSNPTAVLNPLHQMAGVPSVLYDLMFTVYEPTGLQKERFVDFFLKGEGDLFEFRAKKIQGDPVKGNLIGGNLRSLLVTAGTPWWPIEEDAILFLEGLGGSEKRITTMFWQLRQMGVFRQVKGVILGQFTEADEEEGRRGLTTTLAEAVDDDSFPIWHTPDIGHATDSKGMVFGAEADLS